MRGIKYLVLTTLLTVALAAPAASQWSLDAEGGMVWSGYNNVRIPGDTGTKFSLTRDLNSDGAAFVRLRLSWQFHPRHALSLLYAPLKLAAAGTLDRDVFFVDQVFPAGQALRGTYVFNSYRLTYRYALVRRPRFEAGIGLTIKVRDALIRLENQGGAAAKKDLGFVPLINFRVLGRIGKSWGVLFEGDALAAPQGRAEDVSLAAWVDLTKSLRLKAGYRIVEGGASNDEVYTFALFHYAVVGAVLTF
jgi:hypothetical protein